MDVHIVQTRKELEKQEREVSACSRSVLTSINDHKTQTDSVVRDLRMEIDQTKKCIDSRVNDITGEIQQVKRANKLEISKLNAAIGNMQAKIVTERVSDAASAVQQTAIVRADTGQPVSSASTVGSNCNPNPSVSGMDGCHAPVCNENTSVSNQPINPSTNNVNANSEVLRDDSDLSELNLPAFKDSTTQVPLRFIRDLDQYFSIKKTPEPLKLALVFRAVQQPFARQWLSSAFDKLKTYEEFKKGFAELLWCPSRQASVRSSIYFDRHVPGSGGSYLDHYIRYANLASTLNPPMTDLDLLSALTSHFEPRAQQGLICSNIQSTQDALTFLAKIQALEGKSDSYSPSRRDHDRRNSNRRPHNASDRDDRDRREGGNSDVNVRYVGRQSDRRNTRFNDRRQNGQDGQSFNRRGQGRVRADADRQLNPTATNFEPRTDRYPSNQNNRSNTDTALNAQHLNN
jgi:hypothetical protein